MNNFIEFQEQHEYIKKYLEEGFNRFEICKKMGIKNHRWILWVARKYNFYDIYEKTLIHKYRNPKIKNPNARKEFIERLKKISLEKRLQRYYDLEKKYGKEIKRSLENGCCAIDIQKIIGKGVIPTIKFLKYYGYYKKATENGKKIQAQKARLTFINNSRNSHQKKVDYLESLPKINDDAIQLYKTALQETWFKKELFDELEKISQHHNLNSLRLMLGNLPSGKKGFRNNMYGKTPPKGAGCGIYGYICKNGKKIFFRSSLELKIYLYLIENNINFLISVHRIKYKFRTQENLIQILL